jgi:hypothetical protein
MQHRIAPMCHLRLTRECLPSTRLDLVRNLFLCYKENDGAVGKLLVHVWRVRPQIIASLFFISCATLHLRSHTR